MQCLLVIFGGTGDLAHRKLYPAIYNLHVSGYLPVEFAVVSIGRKDINSHSFRQEVAQSINRVGRSDASKNLDDVLSRLYYFKLDFYVEQEYCKLRSFLDKIDEQHGIGGNRVYYLAVAPDRFVPVVRGLAHAKMALQENQSWQRVVIEKPFGYDLASAYGFNREIQQVFGEDSIYRIDHYLGKEMLQNIMAIRFANSIFEPLWNKDNIDHIQITSSETIGVEDRGSYYEQSGAIRDMVQNHMLQLLMLTTMDSPLTVDAQSIRDEKLKILKSIRHMTEETAKKDIIRGQYALGSLNGIAVPGYRQQFRVSEHSNTETYMAMRMFVDSARWQGVPFYLRTGKRLPVKATEIAVVFKSVIPPSGMEIQGELHPNTLIIKVQPQEAVVIWLNGKRPGVNNEIIPVAMGFCQNCAIGEISPDAYERLLYDIMRGDSAFFVHWEEVEHSWRFIDEIVEIWNKETPDFPNYMSGTWGPAAADELLQRDGRSWNKHIGSERI